MCHAYGLELKGRPNPRPGAKTGVSYCHVAMGQKDANPWGPQVQACLFFLLPNRGFSRYPVFLTHTHFDEASPTASPALARLSLAAEGGFLREAKKTCYGKQHLEYTRLQKSEKKVEASNW